MSEQKKAINMTPEELDKWLESLPAPKNDLLYPHFSDPDPYFKMEHTPREQVQSCSFNEDGHLTVRNYCAMALPQITVTLRSGRTIYRFNGSYDGTRSLPAKVFEHMAKDANRD